ncbi:MAG TPA: Ada metal-binding domain-containing protein [Cyclobacteriaceae bacterium]|nr:Ada metal-binding domain-containing protein [Cyclobacteriaceae bacterium]
MIRHINFTDREIRKLIRNKNITYAGNVKLKIVGTLHCTSGKRMKRVNRVFFSSLQEAASNTFRPCGHCMRSEYQQWKNESIQQR